jgi:hypothetical protein
MEPAEGLETRVPASRLRQGTSLRAGHRLLCLLPIIRNNAGHRAGRNPQPPEDCPSRRRSAMEPQRHFRA